VLQPGNAFGECALLKEPKYKFYNAIALTDCVLLAVSRHDYISALSSVEKRILQEKMSFLKSMPEFNHITMTRHKLTDLCDLMEPVTFYKSRVICKQGSESTSVYLIKSGLVNICQSVVIPSHNEEENLHELLESGAAKIKKTAE
jgi:CRP-like cAMP-binding protein